MSFEIEQAQTQLQDIKEKLEDYLKQSYPEETSAIEAYKYLETIVDDICKRKEVHMSFRDGADPCWHADVYEMFSEWIRLEDELAMMLSKAVEDF